MLRLPRHRFIQYADLSAPVRFDGCDDLVASIERILCGWNIREVAGIDASSSPMRISRASDGYRRVTTRHSTASRSRAKLRGNVVAALCGFHFELIDWYLDEHPDRLFVHGAAVHLPTGLALLPALAKAGKSTLTVALAAAGCRVQGDDVVPIDMATLEAVSLGIALRIRPPLPADVSPDLRDYVATHAGPTYGNRQYVRPAPDGFAPLGERSQIRTIVQLQRAEGATAEVRPISRADALERLILQNFAREVPAAGILDTLHRVVQGATCVELCYDRVEDGARALIEGHWLD